jgi:hypothetical protein
MKNRARKETQNFNLLTANVGHPAVAKQIIESILIDANYNETTLDGLVMLIQAFADKSDSAKAKDFAFELQQFIFTKTVEFDSATEKYIESIKAGKNYKTEYLHLVAG